MIAKAENYRKIVTTSVSLLPVGCFAVDLVAVSIHLKVGSCPNDDNFVHILLLSFSV